MDGIKSFIRELRGRKLFRSAAFYIGGAWIVIQAVDLAFPGLGIPEGAIRYVWIGAFVGLPLALLFAWRYQVTGGGILRTVSLDTGEIDTVPLRRPDYFILGAMLLVAGGVGFHLVNQIRQVPASGYPALAANEISPNSVAVLPFENVAGDPDQEYFTAGMHDGLITTLSKIGALMVTARSSANVYRNVVQPARQTGLELGVAKLVEGSVFRVRDRVQVNVRLIDAMSQKTLWSESYERDIQDVLTLQNEITRAVAEEIRAELTPAEKSRLASSRKVDPEVYETYLRGMYHLNQYTPEGMRKGLAYLHEAVEMSPDDPLAYAGLAQGYTLIGHGANPPPDAFLRAREAATRALELDPLFAEAHAAMAEIQLYYDWDWDGAERSFRRALQLSPNLEFAHAHYGWYLQLVGDAEGAIEEMKRAVQIAPVTPIFTAWLGWLYWEDEQLDRAVAEAQESLELNPSFPWGLYLLGGAYAAKSMYEEALATYERLLEIKPNVARWGLADTYARMGRESEARDVLARLAEDPGQKDLLFLGVVHARLGDRTEALRWLETACESRVDWFPWVAGKNAFRGALNTLWDEPRFRELIAGLDLPETG